MKLEVIMSVFTMIFLAELGDKTQLAILACAAYERSKWNVFIGAALALVAASAIATLAGALVSKHVPAEYISKAAGVMFIAFGVMFLVKS